MNKTGLIAKISIKYVLLNVFGNISGGFRVFWGISRDFAEIPEFCGSTTARNIRSPDKSTNHEKLLLICFLAITLTLWRPFPLKFLGKSRAQKREQQTAPPSYHFHAQTLIDHLALDQSVCEKSFSYGKNTCWGP